MCSSDLTGTTLTTNFPVDLAVSQYTGGDPAVWYDRLRGANSPNYTTALPYLRSDATTAEATYAYSRAWNNTSIQVPAYYNNVPTVWWNFRRAPGFFDVVCYTGTGVDGATFNHNLTVVPELMIVKLRSAATDNWFVYSSALGATKALYLNATSAAATSVGFWNDTAPTNSVFSTYSAFTNQSGQTYVAYLFATVAGVSKVGSYKIGRAHV